MRAAWEAMNNGWNQWVLNYTQTKQLDLLKNIGFESPSWEDLGYLLISIVVAVSLVGAAWTLWEKNRHDPWLTLLEAARRRLARAGVQIAPNSPPRSVAAQMTAQRAVVAAMSENTIQSIHDWLHRLEASRYAPASIASHPTLKTLQREFKQLAWPR